MQTIQVIEELSFIMLDIEIWGGAKKLQPADLAQNGIDITKLPPSALATLGQKRIIDKKELHCFHADKARAERLILKTGCRFLKGYMVPNKDIKVTNDGLLEIKDNFENNRTVFLDNYEDKRQLRRQDRGMDRQQPSRVGADHKGRSRVPGIRLLENCVRVCPRRATDSSPYHRRSW